MTHSKILVNDLSYLVQNDIDSSAGATSGESSVSLGTVEWKHV